VGFEIAAFFLIFAIFYFAAMYGWVKTSLGHKRRARALNRLLLALRGNPLKQATRELGEPTEIVFASSGNRLYIWKAPAHQQIPAAEGTVVVTLRIDPADTVTEATWKVLG
jgi:hypothetical protein